jgi:hypothetical protein
MTGRAGRGAEPQGGGGSRGCAGAVFALERRRAMDDGTGR